MKIGKYEINKAYVGEVLEFTRSLPDACIDVIFTDPPFNIGKSYKNDSTDRRSDYREWCEAWIPECFRILKPSGTFYLMTITRHLEWKMPVMAKHGVFINLITWRNVSASHDKRRFWNEYQPILMYGKTTDYLFNQYAETQETGWRRWGGYTTEFKGQLKDRWEDISFIYAGSIQHSEAILQPGTKKKAHPCQMPVGLPLRAIRFSSGENGVVYDPFCGSGSTAVAAQFLKRKFLVSDLSEEYVNLTNWRLQQPNPISPGVKVEAGMYNNALALDASPQPVFEFCCN